ncbi:MAG: hypothetical protein P8163_15455, partial [Candidatus Thiodiazotropha sp.]
MALFREQWQGQDYALLMLMPPAAAAAEEPLSRELVFIIDHSGSMSGPSMAQAKAALRLAVSRLKSDERFNLKRSVGQREGCACGGAGQGSLLHIHVPATL